MGISFAPVGQEFQNLVLRIVRRRGRNILILPGGFDCEHITLEFVKEICKRAADDITFHLIVGTMNEDKKFICDRAKDRTNSGAEDLEQQEELKSAGNVRSIGAEKLIKAVVKLCGNYETRVKTVEMLNIADGYGVDRIIKRVLDGSF